jgi:hypothetical protein
MDAKPTIFGTEVNMSRLVLLFIYFCIVVGNLYQEGRVGIPLTGLTPPYFCACPKPGPAFPMSYVVVIFYVK